MLSGQPLSARHHGRHRTDHRRGRRSGSHLGGPGGTNCGRRGGDSGPAVVPGNLKESLLIEAIHYENKDFAMPPKKLALSS